MSRKHYREAAGTFQQALQARAEGKSSGYIIELFADGISTMFSDDNPRFNHERFFDACGLDENGWIIKR